MDYLQATQSEDDFCNHDMWFKGRKLECKTKKRASLKPPLLRYEGSVNTRRAGHQKCDYYLFASASNPTKRHEIKAFEVVYLMGFISQREFLLKRRLIPNKTEDGDNGWVSHMDTHNIHYSDLYPIWHLWCLK